jgi:hypothetical protein
LGWPRARTEAVFVLFVKENLEVRVLIAKLLELFLNRCGTSWLSRAQHEAPSVQRAMVEEVDRGTAYIRPRELSPDAAG